jgi:hypothetical protein
MREETLASILSGVVRFRAKRAPHEANELARAIAICDECGRAQAKGRRKAVGLAALKMYTFEVPCVYAELNAAMRNNDAAAIAPYGRYVSTMVEAMHVSPRFEGPTVYRGIKLDMRAACTKGSTLVWPEFASCTSSIETQEAFLGRTGDRTLFVLTLTQRRARSIADVSMMPGESEVLLPPNTRVTVESAYCAGNGLLLVSASEMPTECLLAALEIAAAAEAAEAAEAAQAEAKEAEAERRKAEAVEAVEAARKEAERKEAERKEAERKEAERKEAACRVVQWVCVVLVRITWFVTRVTLIGAGTAVWLVVRRVVQWLFESDEWPALLVSLVVTWLCESDERGASAVAIGVLAAIVCRSWYGGCLSQTSETTWSVTRVTLIGAGKAIWLVARLASFVVRWLLASDEHVSEGPVRPVGPVRQTEVMKAGPTEGNKMTPSLVSASVAALGGLAIIIVVAQLATRLCEYRERRAFLF